MRGLDLIGLGRAVAGVVAAAVLAACADLPAATGAAMAPTAAATGGDSDRLIVVALAERSAPVPGVGATPRADYRRPPGYSGSPQVLAAAAEVAQRHGLEEVSAWTIAPLRWRCMLYRIAPGAVAAEVLAALARDPQVALAQPLNRFETLAAPATTAYNDPYIGLQRGFSAIDAGEAQRWSRGDGIQVAVIDTAIDATHPDLDGRVGRQRDFVPTQAPTPGGERHGTEVAGIIAAGANNRVGIVGIAPHVQLLAYRACWPVAGGTSRCDSYTLAQAMGAAITAGADIINLSLGGPPDPLLARLAEHAVQRGILVVGAVPPNGRIDGFPVGVPGVIAVASVEDAMRFAPGQVLAAPGRDILTLTPGGRYDYASGSSLATAHVSGALALLLALRPRLAPAAATALLAGRADGPIDVCRAVSRLGMAGECAADRLPPAVSAPLVSAPPVVALPGR